MLAHADVHGCEAAPPRTCVRATSGEAPRVSRPVPVHVSVRRHLQPLRRRTRTHRAPKRAASGGEGGARACSGIISDGAAGARSWCLDAYEDLEEAPNPKPVKHCTVTVGPQKPIEDEKFRSRRPRLAGCATCSPRLPRIEGRACQDAV